MRNSRVLTKTARSFEGMRRYILLWPAPILNLDPARQKRVLYRGGKRLERFQEQPQRSMGDSQVNRA